MPTFTGQLDTQFEDSGLRLYDVRWTAENQREWDVELAEVHEGGERDDFAPLSDFELDAADEMSLQMMVQDAITDHLEGVEEMHGSKVANRYRYGY